MKQYTSYWLWLRRFSFASATAGAAAIVVVLLPATPHVVCSMQSSTYMLWYDGETASMHFVIQNDPWISVPDGWHLVINDGEQVMRWRLPGIRHEASGNVDMWLPVWTVAVALFALSAILLFVTRRSRGSTQCSRCGYDLTGNTSGTCPECGFRSRMVVMETKRPSAESVE